MEDTDASRPAVGVISRVRDALLSRASRLGRRGLAALAVGGVLLLIAALCLAAGAVARSRAPASTAATDGVGGEYVVTRYGPGIRLRRGEFLWSFRRRGTLEPFEKKIIACRAHGTIKFIWDEGKRAKEGDVVFELDANRSETRIAEREAELRVRRAVLVQTERSKAKAVKEAELAAKSAELELEWEKLNEKLLLAGPTTTELARTRADVKTRGLVARNRLEELRILEELSAKGFATSPEVGRKRLQLTEAGLDLERASASLRRLLAGPDEPERQEARLRVEIAGHALESARKKLESVKAMAASAIVREEKLVSREEERLRRERAELEKHVIRAPTDGYVLHIPTHWGGKWTPGSRIWHGVRVMSMPVGSRLKAVTKVSPAEIDLVKEGTKALVTVPAAPGRQYEGEVTVVGSQGKDEFDDLDGYTSKKVGKSGRRAFAVEVKFADDTPELRPGLHAEIEFVVEEIDRALIIPWGTVTRTDDGASVTVIEDGEPVTRPVELGASNRHAVVIESGCDEGEIVLLAWGSG